MKGRGKEYQVVYSKALGEKMSVSSDNFELNWAEVLSE